MKNQYKIGKYIKRFSGILFVSAFVVAVATGNSDFSAGMVIASWFMFIAGLIVKGTSPEQKAIDARKREEHKKKWNQYQKKAEQEEKEKLKEKASQDSGPNMWLSGGIGALIAFPFAVILKIAGKYNK